MAATALTDLITKATWIQTCRLMSFVRGIHCVSCSFVMFASAILADRPCLNRCITRFTDFQCLYVFNADVMLRV